MVRAPILSFLFITLNRPLRLQSESSQHQCPYCSISVLGRNAKVLFNHIRLKHNSEIENIWLKCETCFKLYPDETTLRTHDLSCCPVKKSRLSTRIDNGKVFYSQDMATKHVMKCEVRLIGAVYFPSMIGMKSVLLQINFFCWFLILDTPDTSC
jgi:hypothetical protein